MPRRREEVDRLLDLWARARREVLGYKEPAKASGMVGAPRCTLGARRDLHAGSRSLGRIEQHWPEVFTGEAFDVNQAFKKLDEPQRVALDIAVVYYTPPERAARAELAGIHPKTLERRLALARAYIKGALGL